MRTLLRVLTLAGFLAGAARAQQAPVVGTWQGTLDAGVAKVRLAVHINAGPNGTLTSTLDNLDQNARGIPIAATTFQEGKLHLEMTTQRATFDGTLSADGQQLSGTFTQGQPFALTLARVATVTGPVRPQEPKPPFPYDAQDVVYPVGDIRLAGTLTLPRGTGPFPVALMISGSGPQDRDEFLLAHKPFLVIADYLTRRGIAVLRVDDRGVGKSTGAISTTQSMDEMAADVLAGIAYLRTRAEIDPRRIGVIGHSEGGIVGPMAAVRSQDISFVVMLAGTGVPGDELLYMQGEAVARNAGVPEAAIASNRAVQKMIFDIVKAENDPAAALEKLGAAWQKFKDAAPEAQRQVLAAGDGRMQQQFVAVNSPEFRSILNSDPGSTPRRLKTPLLALIGDRDVQVPSKQNLAGIRAALTEVGNKDFSARELPGLNHLFQTCKTCTVAEYGDLEETFSPSALEAMGTWLAEHTQAK